MRNFAIRAVAGEGFRLTLDLSSWAAVGVDLTPSILRMQVYASAPTIALEFATGGAHPIVFDPATGLATFSASASATLTLLGVFHVVARAEFTTFEIPLFGGSLTFVEGVVTSTVTSGVPVADTAWIAAQPFGPAPVPASLVTAVASAQSAARTAFVRSTVFG